VKKGAQGVLNDDYHTAIPAVVRVARAFWRGILHVGLAAQRAAPVRFCGQHDVFN
jgi:hypothetical protein